MFSRALLFDMDGTLTNSDHIHHEAFIEIGRDFDIEVTEETYRRVISGRANQAIFRDLFPHVDAAEHPRLADAKEARYRELMVGRLEPIAGVVELLEWAKAKKVGLAVVSNAPRPNIEDMLEQLGIAGYFDTVVVGIELPRGKPDPLPYLTGLERLGVPAEHAIAFEDAPPGIQAAHAAKIATVGLTTTLDSAAAKANGAVIAVPDYRHPALWELIAKVIGE